MSPYPKIRTVFKRNMEAPGRTKPVIDGDFSLPEFDFLRDNCWLFTEKVDGTNIRVMFDPTPIHGGTSTCPVTFDGKSERSDIPSDLVNRLSDLFMYQIGLLFEMFDAPVCLYGEGYGPKIQGGGKYLSYLDFALFDVKIGSWWLRRCDVEQIAESLSLTVVPVIGSGSLSKMVAIARDGFDSQWGQFIAEGIVAHPMVDLACRSGSRVITKIKCKDFSA